MTPKAIFIIFTLLISLGSRLSAQDVMLSSGGNSVDGNVGYSFGQFAFQYFSNNDGSVAQGVQYPFELSENPFVIIPEDLIVVDTIFSELDNCLGALQNITIAGDGNDVNVSIGANVNFIAGQTIRFLPGFHAIEGSTVNAYITTDNTFCGTQISTPIVSATQTSPKSILLPSTQVTIPEEKSVKVYPNPNNGRFTLLLNNFDSNVKTYIYNTLGAVIYQSEISNDTLHEIDLGTITQGIYFVRIVNNKDQFMHKIIINR